jgi:predicted Zn-dependent protease
LNARTTALALALWALGCAPRPRARDMTETIAGVVRPRAFASATAYEALLRAEVAIGRGDFEGAARQLELATFADDTDGWLCARRAEVLLLSGARDEGLEAARACTRRFAEQAASWIVLGEALVDRGSVQDATAAFTRALAVAPDDPEVRESVALGQGAARSAAARARENAPQSRASDQTIARRALLDEGRDRRPTLAMLRRQRAREARDRGAFSAVDALLTPLYVSQRASVEDRVEIIEARVADGRASAAAAVVAALPVGEAGAGVSRVELARLWLRVGRAELALEAVERARSEGRQDALTRRLHGTALGRVGRTSEAIAMLATIEPEDGEFVEAQIEAATALSRGARSDLADRVLEAAIARLGLDGSRAIDRDRLRVARAKTLVVRSLAAQARAAAATVETVWGRQQRGVLFARDATSAAEVLRDLRERSGDRPDDGRAGAWLVLVCARFRGTCSEGEIDRSLADAVRWAEEDPATLAARATRAAQPAEAEALRRRAHERDPLTFSVGSR